MFLVRAPPLVDWPKLILPPLWLAVVLPLGCFTAAVVVLWLFGPNTPIWISNSLVVTALLRNRRSTWPALFGLAALADYAANCAMVKGMSIVAIGIVVCDITEILLVTTLAGFTETASLEESVWPIARLALVSVLVPLVSATGGASLLNLAYNVPFGEAWENWYLANTGGLLIVTPLLLTWTDRRLRTSDWRPVVPKTLLLAGLAAIVSYLDFHDALPGLFLVFPFLLLTTFHGRLLGATTAAAVVATVAIWSTFTGHGPIATFAGTNAFAKIHYLQLYIAVVLLSVLPLAALLGQRERFAAQLRAFTETLEERVNERTRQLQAENEARRQTEAALRERESRMRRLVDSNIIGIHIWDFDGRIVEANDEFLRMVGYDREDLAAGRIRWADLTPPDWRDRNNARIEQQKASGRFEPFEKEYTRKDGSRVPVLIGGATFEEGGNQGLAFVLDLSQYKQVEAEAREMHMGLARANRVATMGQLAASTAHEVKQPIGATVSNAQAALRFLGRQTPDLEEARQALAQIVQDGIRAGNIVDGIRALTKRAASRKERLDINAAIGEVIELTRGEVVKNGVSVQTDLAEGIQSLEGDRVQLQQVILNLMMNAVEAMNATSEGARELLISTRKTESDAVLVSVGDSGPGLETATIERLFEAFYTTKPGGLGMGLSICRSIIEAHGGRMWATANVPHGATFQFTLPVNAEKSS